MRQTSAWPRPANRHSATAAVDPGPSPLATDTGANAQVAQVAPGLSRTASRRQVLAAGGVVVAAAAVTSACGSAAPAGGSATTAATADAGSAAGFKVPTADVPVGGGRIFAAQKLVVTQPTAGEFRAFSAVCTHQGCLVGSVTDSVIECPCHGSKFAISDGSVQAGPAARALPGLKLTSSGDSLTVG